MEQRREARFPAQQPIRVTVIGQPTIHLDACVKNVSGRGIGIETERALPTGTAVKLVLEDDLLMGEVIYCRWRGVEILYRDRNRARLYGLAELARIMELFAEEDSGEYAVRTLEDARRRPDKVE